MSRPIGLFCTSHNSAPRGCRRSSRSLSHLLPPLCPFRHSLVPNILNPHLARDSHASQSRPLPPPTHSLPLRKSPSYLAVPRTRTFLSSQHLRHPVTPSTPAFQRTPSTSPASGAAFAATAMPPTVPQPWHRSSTSLRPSSQPARAVPPSQHSRRNSLISRISRVPFCRPLQGILTIRGWFGPSVEIGQSRNPLRLPHLSGGHFVDFSSQTLAITNLNPGAFPVLTAATSPCFAHLLTQRPGPIKISQGRVVSVIFRGPPFEWKKRE